MPKEPTQIQTPTEALKAWIKKEAELESLIKARADAIADIVAPFDVSIQLLSDEVSTLYDEVRDHYFSDAKEGTSYAYLPDQWRLKATCKIDRKVDEAALESIKKTLPEGVETLVFRYEPSLQVRAYRDLNDETRKLVDEAIITKAPKTTFVLVPPKS